MIFGKPYEFAVFYELLEKTDNDYWKFGIFIFFIEDEIYPTRGSNYTLSMALDYLKDSLDEVISYKNSELDTSMEALLLLKKLAHSHGILLCDDPHNLELSEPMKLGIYLSPLEFTDTGFYLFYYPRNNNEEYLIYSSDYGATAKKTVLEKGTVQRVIKQLPNKDKI